jgi:hypothetical protein
VIATTEEWTPGVSWKGTNVGIQLDTNPAFHVAIMYIDLIHPLQVGDKVSAGQLLGTPPAYDNVTMADTIVGVKTTEGYRLISYFEALNDHVF